MVKLPGFLTPLGLQLAVAALLLVAIVYLLGGGHIFSPGSLSAANRTGAVLGEVRSHAELGANCEACHTAPWSSQSMNDLCVACHTDIQSELSDSSTLHGALDGQDCRKCHVEHRGPQGYLTEVSRLEIDHNKFGFSLDAHQLTVDNRPFACTDCHTEILARFEPARCETCHRSNDDRFITIHVTQFGADCRACHDGTDLFSEGKFDHNRLNYPLLGKHAEVECIDCHTGVGTLAGFKEAPTDCAGCHQQDNQHPPNFGTDCARCHNTDAWQTEIFDHNLSTFKLTGQHAEVACSKCHVGGVFRGTPQECVACHVQDDVHSLMLGTDCAECHTPQDWKQVTFDHSQTRFKLTGKHTQVACTQCHQNNIFAGTPTRCVSCHAKDDVHRGQFGQDCAHCHTTETWKLPSMGH
ncbi:MAG: hypothetical protein DPW09_01475 [Anaerolineae bacterium]|nr:hypothetical protein [Anaerolineae bacterium]